MFFRRMSTFLFSIGTLLLTAGIAALAVAVPGVEASSPAAHSLSQIEPFSDFACLECHTDRARLTELSANVEPEPDDHALSSGPG